MFYKNETKNIEEQRTEVILEETKELTQSYPKAIEKRHQEAERRIISEKERITKEVSTMEMDGLVDALNNELNAYINSTSTMEDATERTINNSK